MWIKEKFSREYHVVCNGKTNRPSEKGLLIAYKKGYKRIQNRALKGSHAKRRISRNGSFHDQTQFFIFKPDCAPSLSSDLLRIKRASNLERVSLHIVIHSTYSKLLPRLIRKRPLDKEGAQSGLKIKNCYCSWNEPFLEFNSALRARTLQCAISFPFL